MKFKLVAILLAVGMLISGCNPASRASEWAEQAVAQTWVATYRIVFHQKDGDLEMTVRETRGETIILDIDMANGTLRLEYSLDNLLIDLDQGGLEWEDFPRQPPYYTLSELSRQIAAAGQLNSADDWATVLGYEVKVEDGAPEEVKYESEWSLYVQDFQWNLTGS